jgi:hypothetical protein
MLHGQRPAGVATGSDMAGHGNHAQPEFELAMGIGLETAHLEIVAVGLDRLVLVVLTKISQADLDAADGDILDTAAETLADSSRKSH